MFNPFAKKPAPTSPTAQPSTTAASPSQTDTTTHSGAVGWAERLKLGLAKTRQHLGGQLSALLNGGKIDEEIYEALETILITADVGIPATQHLLQSLRARVTRLELKDTLALKRALKETLLALLTPLAQPMQVTRHSPYVVMMVGVNGAGKTTTIGKLAKYLQSQGHSVLIAAGDTFRAAAREQLQVWGERNQVHVVASASGDPAAVIFDAVNSAIAKKIDVVIADTAGRLPTQLHLMDEIKKVQRVIDKALPGAPHEILLVLDANTGQNAVMQLQAFDAALKVTGLVLTKLDGTAKGGVIAGIAHLSQQASATIPVRFIGVGEQIDDLRPFDAEAFVDALLGD